MLPLARDPSLSPIGVGAMFGMPNIWRAACSRLLVPPLWQFVRHTRTRTDGGRMQHSRWSPARRSAPRHSSVRHAEHRASGAHRRRLAPPSKRLKASAFGMTNTTCSCPWPEILCFADGGGRCDVRHAEHLARSTGSRPLAPPRRRVVRRGPNIKGALSGAKPRRQSVRHAEQWCHARRPTASSRWMFGMPNIEACRSAPATELVLSKDENVASEGSARTTQPRSANDRASAVWCVWISTRSTLKTRTDGVRRHHAGGAVTQCALEELARIDAVWMSDPVNRSAKPSRAIRTKR